MSKDILDRLESLRQRVMVDDERLTELVDIVKDFVEVQINGTEEERIAQLFSESLHTLPIDDGMPSNAARIILQMYPTSGQKLDVNKLLTSSYRDSLAPIYTSGYNRERNLKGVLSYSGYQKAIQSYTQYNDSGLFVSVEYDLLDSQDGTGKYGIPTVAFEQELFLTVDRQLEIYKWLGVQSPIVISLTLQNVKGYIPFVNFRAGSGLYPIRENELALDPIVVEDLNENPAAKVMKPIFDQVWNAMGRICSPYYTQDGEWREPR